MGTKEDTKEIAEAAASRLANSYLRKRHLTMVDFNDMARGHDPQGWNRVCRHVEDLGLADLAALALSGKGYIPSPVGWTLFGFHSRRIPGAKWLSNLNSGSTIQYDTAATALVCRMADLLCGDVEGLDPDLQFLRVS